MNEEVVSFAPKNLPDYLVKSVNISVVITDFEGRYIFVNDYFYERFKWIVDNFIGLPFAVTVHPDDVEKCNQAAMACMQEPGKMVNVEIRKPRNPMGIYEWNNWQFSQYSDNAGIPRGILCLGYDISKLKATIEKNLKKDVLLDEITNMHAHTIRGALSTIMGLIRIINLDTEHMETAKYLQILKKEGEALDKLIHLIVNKAYNESHEESDII